MRDFASIDSFFSDREIDELQAAVDARREARAVRAGGRFQLRLCRRPRRTRTLSERGARLLPKSRFHQDGLFTRVRGRNIPGTSP